MCIGATSRSVSWLMRRGDNERLLDCSGEVVGQRQVCHGFGKAPRSPVTGTSMVPPSHDQVQVDHLFLGDIIAFRGMGPFPKKSVPARARPKITLEVRAAPSALRISAFARHRTLQMDAGGGTKMKFGGTSDRGAKVGFSFKARAPIPGYWCVGPV